MQVIAHGGAGGTPDTPGPRQAAVEAAARAGSRESDPATAVVTAITVMEHDPQFNAGIGGVVQSDGVVRTDAGIMAEDRSIGAACGMPNVANAIAVAEAVRTNTPHVLLAGKPAVRFARAHDINAVNRCRTTDRHQAWLETGLADASYPEELEAVRSSFGGSGMDTVGAVATDGDRLAAGTSTAGRGLALQGRVGDVPLVGCGFFATPIGGVSTTGAGEAIIQTMLARAAVAELEAGNHPTIAATRAIDIFEAETAERAGIIVATPDGGVGSAYNSSVMQTAVARDGEQAQ